MKKFVAGIVLFVAVVISAFAWDNRNNQGYQGRGNEGYGGYGGYGGYYMGPGMMWGDGGYGGCGYWQDSPYYQDARSGVNLSSNQQNQWDEQIQKGRKKQQAINDSIKYFVEQVYRLQKDRSVFVQEDLQAIKNILTPEQYQDFLERLIAKDGK